MNDAMLKADAAFLLRELGEDVVAVDVVTKATRPIRAFVDRLSPTVGSDGRRLEARTYIEVLNDAAKGIPAAADTGAVRVRMAFRQGGEVKDWSIAMADDADGYSDVAMTRWQIK